MRPLLLLSVWQVKNAVRSNLRNPVVWVPVLIIALLLLTRFQALALPQRPMPPGVGQFLSQHLRAVHAGVFLMLSLLALGYLDTGFAGGSLRFTNPDVALLFPAPFSRRLVLLFKLPSALAQHLLMIAFLAGMFRLLAWLPIQQQSRSHGDGWPALLATMLCLSGFLNLAILLDLLSSRKRQAWVGTGFRWVTVLAIIGLTRFLWTHGLDGLSMAADSPLIRTVFFPCRLAADAVAASWQSVQLSGYSWVNLVGWYALTLWLLFTRRVNYYEAAALGAERADRVRQALRSGNWAAIRTQPTRAGRLAVLLPTFGRGGGALVWAHLVAAAKRPGVNFVLPFFGGLGCTLLVGLVAIHAGGKEPDFSETTIAGISVGIQVITGYYLFYAVALLAAQFYRRSLARETLIRPLPLSMRLMVGADVGARAFLGSLFTVGEAFALLLLHLPGTGTLSLFLLVSAPVLVVFLNVWGYRLALLYPNASDKLQAVAVGFVQFLAYGLLSLFIAPFWAIPTRLHTPGWVTVLSVTTGLLLATGFLFRQTVRAAATFESSEEPPPHTFGQWRRDFAKGLSSPLLKKVIKPFLVIGVIVGLTAFLGSRFTKALHKPPLPPRTVTTRRGDLIVKVSESGMIQPVDKVNVESKAPGRLLSIPITEGQRVQRGQLIAVVDRSQLDPQIAGLRAQLSQAQARLQQTQAQYSLQVSQTQAAIAQAQAGLHSAETHLAAVAAAARPQELAQQRQGVQRAKITLDDALRTQTRKQVLLAKGFIAQSDADAAQVAVDTASSSLASAQQALALTEAGPRPQDVADARSQVAAQQVALATARTNAGQVAVSREDILQARGAVAQIQNQLAQFLVQLGDTRIVAPASGIVLKKYKQPNEIVQSATTGFSDAQSLVATLGSRLEVLVGINEVDIPKVHVGASVNIRVDAIPGVVFEGGVTEVAPASTNAFAETGTTGGSDTGISKFNVKVALRRYDPRLRPGMTANVDIISARHPQVVLAPLEAVPATGDRAAVTVLTNLNVRETRPVALGLRDDTDVEVVRGLRPGEKLVVLPIDGKGRRKFNVNDGN